MLHHSECIMMKITTKISTLVVFSGTLLLVREIISWSPINSNHNHTKLVAIVPFRGRIEHQKWKGGIRSSLAHMVDGKFICHLASHSSLENLKNSLIGLNKTRYVRRRARRPPNRDVTCACSSLAVFGEVNYWSSSIAPMIDDGTRFVFLWLFRYLSI